MQDTNTGTAVLGDLLRINKDCFNACLRVIDKANDKPLYTLVEGLVDMGRDFSWELRCHVDHAFGDPAAAIERKGEIYKAWLANRTLRIPTKQKEIHAFCEGMIQAVYFAYERALNNKTGLPDKVITMLSIHVKRLNDSVECIKKSRKEKSSSARELLVTHY